MIVMKFGGTSVQDASAMLHVADIAEQYGDEQILVVSSACSGMTSELLKLATDSVHISDEERIQRIAVMENRHISIASSLGIEEQVGHRIHELCNGLRNTCEGVALLGECTPRSSDAIASFGELLSTVVLQGLLKQHNASTWYDAREVVKTDSGYQVAQVDFSLTQSMASKKLKPLFDSHRIIVTQGFIGSDSDGNTTTLGRGGSDFSAALLGAALHADEIIIWTDVSGIASADPRIIPEARFIETMSFDEARMLSFFGAKVLHPETIIPALSNNIPVHVRNTFKSADKGTTITQLGDKDAIGFRSVIGKQIVTCVNISGIPGTDYHNKKLELLDQISRLSGQQPLIHARVGESETYVYDAPMHHLSQCIDKEQNLMNITVEEYSLISAIGPNLRSEHSKKAVGKFYETVLSVDPQPVFISGIQPQTVSALVAPDCAIDILKALHPHCS